MVEPFGIHLARVEPDKGQVIETENAINKWLNHLEYI